MIKGTLDLVIYHSLNKISVLDFKTGPVVYQNDADLYKYCVVRGYKSQISLYCQAMRALYPQAEVNAIVWFTKDLNIFIFKFFTLFILLHAYKVFFYGRLSNFIMVSSYVDFKNKKNFEGLFFIFLLIR